MATITANTNFTIAGASTEQASVDILVLPVAGAGGGRGRLVHPVLGTLDYDYSPEQWVNIDGDVLIAPMWSGAKTLDGGQNTLWPGHIKDVVCRERWRGKAGLTMPLTMLRSLISFWATPPDPESDYVLWYPSYTTTFGYKVVLVGLTVGGREITLNTVTRRISGGGTYWVGGAVELSLRVVDYAV